MPRQRTSTSRSAVYLNYVGYGRITNNFVNDATRRLMSLRYDVANN